MGDNLFIRKQTKMLQYLENLSFEQRLNIIIFRSYCNDMEKICENMQDFKESKILQDVYQDFYEDIAKNISDLSEEKYKVKNSFDDIVRPESSMGDGWPASFKESDEDSYASMPFSKDLTKDLTKDLYKTN